MRNSWHMKNVTAHCSVRDGHPDLAYAPSNQGVNSVYVEECCEVMFFFGCFGGNF